MSAIETIKKQKDFQNIYRNGSVFGNRNLVIYYRKNNNNMNRMAVVVSKKVSNKAVVRNKLRRQLKESYRLRLGQIKKGYDLIFIVKPVCAEAPYSVIHQALGHVLYKTNLLGNNDDKK